MREILLFPFQGMYGELTTLFRSMIYILKVRMQLLFVVVRHLLQNGDSVALAKHTWKARMLAQKAEGICLQCTEETSALRTRLHRGAVHEITARTKLRRSLATMPLRSPDYLEQLSADGVAPKNFDREPHARVRTREMDEEIAREDASEALESPKHPKV